MEKVIGFVTEPRFYRVGSFVLKQVPGVDRTLDEPDPTMKVLEVLGLTNAQSILDMTIRKYWDDLEATGKVRKALAMVLTVEGKDKVENNVEEIVGKMSRRVAAEVLKDFFEMNFGSTPQSEVSAGNTTLN